MLYEVITLVELLNVLCPRCRKQTKPYTELYAMLEADPATRGRIKMLGVAVARNLGKPLSKITTVNMDFV